MHPVAAGRESSYSHHSNHLYMGYGDNHTDQKWQTCTFLGRYIWAQMTAQTKLLNAKTITHHTLGNAFKPINHYSGPFGFENPDPVEAVVVKLACLEAGCCSGQMVGSIENSSSPEHMLGQHHLSC